MKIGRVMSNSSILIELMFRSDGNPIGKKSLKVHNVRLISKNNFNLSWEFLEHFCFEPELKVFYSFGGLLLYIA